MLQDSDQVCFSDPKIPKYTILGIKHGFLCIKISWSGGSVENRGQGIHSYARSGQTSFPHSSMLACDLFGALFSVLEGTKTL